MGKHMSEANAVYDQIMDGMWELEKREGLKGKRLYVHPETYHALRSMTFDHGRPVITTHSDHTSKISGHTVVYTHTVEPGVVRIGDEVTVNIEESSTDE